MGDLLKLKNITFKYPNSNEIVLNNLSLNIKENEFVTIIGQNGSGKSTLAKMLNGILTPNSGHVIVDKFRTTSKNKEDIWNIRERVGMVFQNPVNQIVAHTVEEDIAFALENKGLDPDLIKKRVDEVIYKLDIASLRYVDPRYLSGGQIQKVAIAGVLALEPKVIIFDEATSMLDPISRKEILQVVGKLKQENGITIINITHSLEEAIYSDRVVVLYRGSVLLDEKPSKALTNTEVLEQVGLSIPLIVEIANELRKEGIPLREDIITSGELVNELWKLR